MDFDEKKSAATLVAVLSEIYKADGDHLMVNTLGDCECEFYIDGYDNWDGGIDLCGLKIEISKKLYSQLFDFLESYENSIHEKMQKLFRRFPGRRLTSVQIHPTLRDTADEVMVEIENMAYNEINLMIENQRDLMISVATNGPRINSVNNEYKKAWLKIKVALSGLGFNYPNPYSDLWEWYERWSSGDFPTYASRRSFIRSMFKPVLLNPDVGIESESDSLKKGGNVEYSPTGWARVDIDIGEASKRLETASEIVHFNQIGVTCRMTFLFLAHEVYNSKTHATEREDKTPIGKDDVVEQLGAFVDHEIPGRSNRELRQYLKSSLRYTHKITHAKSSTFREAALCTEATRSVINQIAIIAGKRDKK